jgi:2-dehydro-3-deoxyphosphogluconate aldolase/(4S)-4-hydroxy-2-oxoglutarate aldolase
MISSTFNKKISPKEQAVCWLSKYKLIAVISSQKSDLSEDFLKVVGELYGAGVRVFEVTDTTAQCLRLIKLLHEFKNSKQILVGVGTIQGVKDLRPYVKYIDFAVSDIIPDKSTFALAKRHQLVMIPGALTPNEIKQAYCQGADFVKVFPASWIGPKNFRAIRRTHGHIPLMPTGGVSSKQVKEYLSAGAGAFGIGSGIFRDELLEQARLRKDYTIFARRAAKFIQAIRPRIFGAGEVMVEILLERSCPKSKKVPEKLLSKYISQMDYRLGRKRGWRSGSLCRDLDKLFKEMPTDNLALGQEIEIKADEFKVIVRCASDVPNVLTVVAQMGGEAILLSGVGGCAAARFLVNWYQKRGLNLECIKKVRAGHCGVFFLLNIGKRYSRLGSAVNQIQLPKALYRSGDILHFTGISQMISQHFRQQCLKQVKLAHAAGVKISYNLNDRPALRESKQELREAFGEIAPFINYLFLGIEETNEVFGLNLNLPQSCPAFIKSIEPISQRFFQQCPCLESLIITGGKLGFVLLVGKGAREARYYPSNIVPAKMIVEPVGAGDTLIGGFLYALSRYFSPQKSAQVANVSAGLSLLNRGSGGLDSQIGCVEVKGILKRHYGWSQGEALRL